MKKHFVFILFSFTVFITGGQSPDSKVASGIKKLYGEYLTDFKNIKGGLRSDDHYETTYYSRLKLSGSIDSSNLLHFIKERQTWLFSAEMDNEKISAGELNATISSLSFSFGKLKGISSGVEWVLDYVPSIKKGLAEKMKDLFIRVFNGKGNPNDQTGGRLTFFLGEYIDYRNK